MVAQIKNSLTQIGAKSLIQVGAIGGFCLLLLGYVVWNQLQVQQERESMRKELITFFVQSSSIQMEIVKASNQSIDKLAQSIEKLSIKLDYIQK